MVALALLSATAVGLFSYSSIASLVAPRALERIDMRTRLLAADLEAAVRAARPSVVAFGAAPGIEGIVRASLAGGIDPRDGIALTTWRDWVTRRVVTELKANPDYLQFRVIGVADGGREIVGVDRQVPGGPIRVVPDKELQQKSDRPYFQQAIGLPAGEVYVSPVELNVEHGSIQVPHVPVLRTATPIHTPDGKAFGIVVINVDMRAAFARVRSGADPSAQIYLVNQQGDYLIHPDQAREFGFELGKRSRLQDDFPDLGEAMKQTEIMPGFFDDRAGKRFAIALAPVQLAGGPRGTVVQTVPYSEVSAVRALAAVRNSTLIAGLVALLGATALAAAFARSLTGPLVQMTKAAEGFARGERIKAPVGAGGEIGVLARAFASMTAQVEEKTAALRESKARHRAIVDTAWDAIVVIDELGTIQSANPAIRTTFGFAPEEVIGRNVKILMPAEVAAAHDGYLEAYKRTGTRKVIGIRREVEGRRKDGSQFPLDLSVAEWRDAEGRLFFVGNMRDITERKQTQEMLAQASRLEAVGQLAGGVAHDFNNLLAAITGNLELAERSIDTEKPRRWIRAALGAVEMGKSFNQRLLSLALKRKREPRHLVVNKRIQAMDALLARSLRENIELTTALAPDLWPTLADPGEIDSALLNLAINARDAMPGGGALAIETRNVTLDLRAASMHPGAHAGDYVRVSVIDTGTGMPPEVLSRAAEPFFTTKDPGTGTGLGLPSVFIFAKQSGGFATLASQVGKGTTVSIYLPRAAPEVAKFDAGSTNGGTVLQGNGELILVVEDDHLIREATLQRLEALGYAVIEARTAPEAIEWLNSDEPVALVLSDFVMPGGMSGSDLARWVLAAKPGVRVLLMSAYNADLGSDGSDPMCRTKVLGKPFTLAELARSVHDALNAGPDQAGLTSPVKT
jgi:PAS domain S-box-containing protein